jgi:hypothetical protein
MTRDPDLAARVRCPCTCRVCVSRSNIGLEPWEGVELGLEVEAVEGTDRSRPVAPYVAEHDQEWRSWLADRGCKSWCEWLQHYRIELNAMPPADRMAWLTRKIEQHPPRKVIPPHHVLHAERVSSAREALIDELTERARIEERADEIMEQIKWPPAARAAEVTRRYLDRRRRAQWSDPMEAAGKKLAQRTIDWLDDEGQMP